VFGLSFGLVQSSLSEGLGMKYVSVKFVPKLLTLERKETDLALARDLLQCADQDTNFMKTIIAGVDSWVYGTTRKQKPSHSNVRLKSL
jgi:hypothetical protein